MERSIRLVLFLLFSAPLQVAAVTVYINVNRQPVCNYAIGQLTAVASGGVGPYSYLWSNGATTATIINLTAGPYSVTVTDFNLDQAVANVDLTSTNYSIQSPGQYGLCAASAAMVVSNEIIAQGQFTPTLPFFVNGSPMMEFPPDFITSWESYFVAPFIPSMGYGQWYQFPFADGAGCTGTIETSVGWPVQWPSLSVLDVQGSCSGGNNGSITFHTGLEGHNQITQVVLRNAQHQTVPGGYFPAGSQAYTSVAGNLAPGDYWLVQFMSMSAFLPSTGCGDSVMVTVPDLGNTCGNVKGTAFMDYDLNCTRQSNEPYVPGSVVEILPGPYYAMTNGSGLYTTNLPFGNYTAEQQSLTVTEHCAGSPVPFALTAGAGLSTVNMPDTSLVPLDAMLTSASGPARPGFQFQVALGSTNLTPAGSGSTTLTFTFDPLVSFVSASPAGTVVGNTVTWNQSQLTAFQQRTVQVYLQVPPDIGLLGTVLNNSAALTTVNADANTTNNSVILPVIITGAYDPNDKIATTSSGYSTSLYYIDGDEWIDYTIRFQNTGTDTAFHVVITDTIAPELDLGSFVAGAASHGYTVDIRNGNTLRFAFYNIQLPDSNVNELRSHGFVSFRIRPSLPLLPGTVIENTANIFFDFNPPVITDPSVLVAEFSTGVDGERANALIVAPNPTSGEVRITSTSGAIAQVTLFTLDGRMMMNAMPNASMATLSTERLPSGLYLLQVDHANGATSRTRLMKH
ncbi:MAG: T9SS type A sorting domain-containing protein [Flavobacteriales bacterium]|nr:T9SS type A sorting domain-containing protein [Flavobacteriales bacterium]